MISVMFRVRSLRFHRPMLFVNQFDQTHNGPVLVLVETCRFCYQTSAGSNSRNLTKSISSTTLVKLTKFLPLVRARIVSGHLTESGQLFEKCKSFNFSARVR